MRKPKKLVAGTYFPMPTAVLNSAAFTALSLKARALLIDIGGQYNGHNNGDLSPAWTLMKKRGWKSKDTLNRALKELTTTGLIELARQGGKHKASLYSITWMPINECGGKLDVSATRVSSGLWRNFKSDASTQIKKLDQRLPGKSGSTGGSKVPLSRSPDESFATPDVPVAPISGGALTR